MEYPLGGEALSRAEPPAGPPKITKSLGEITFPIILAIFPNFRDKIRHEKQMSRTWRMNHLIRLDLK